MSTVECEIVDAMDNGSIQVRVDGADEPTLVSKKKVNQLEKVQRPRLRPGARLSVERNAGGNVTRIVEVVADAPDFDASAHQEAVERERHEREQQKAREQQRKQIARLAEEARKARDEERKPNDGKAAKAANPYTFVPYFQPAPSSRDAAPRHRTAPWDEDTGELLSGRFTVDLHVRTPVSVLGHDRKELPSHALNANGRPRPLENPNEAKRQLDKEGKGHRVVSAARDSSGLPTIPGSSLKGVLRSWFEAITSSPRLIDESPVAWRNTTLEKAYPARIRVRDANGKPVRDALDKAWDAGKQQLKQGQLTIELEPLSLWRPPHECNGFEEAQAALRAHWNLDQHSTLRDDLTVTAADGRKGRLKVAAGVAKGVPPASLHVFTGSAGRPFAVAPEVVDRWFLAHKHRADDEPRRPDEEAVSAFVPTVDDPRAKKRVARPRTDYLSDGMLVWYRVDERGAVRWFGRIRNGRWAERHPMHGRVPRGHGPAAPGTLSPVEQALGTAEDARAVAGATGGAEGAPEQADAWAGRVRVSSARWCDDDADTPDLRWHTLEVLSAPKLQSAGLYLATDDDRALTWGRDRPKTTRDDSGGAEKPDPTIGRLAGTKTYWHVPPIPDEGIDSRVRTLSYQPSKGKQSEPAKTSQNATVEALHNGTFRFEVTFEDLSPEELGALVLACSLQFGSETAARGWKIGIGKPVGLGSLENELTELVVYDLDARYLDPVTPHAGTSQAGGEGGWDQASLQQAAFARWLGAASSRALQGLDAVARLDTMATIPVAYPTRGVFSKAREVGGSSKQWPDANAVADRRLHPQ